MIVKLLSYVVPPKKPCPFVPQVGHAYTIGGKTFVVSKVEPDGDPPDATGVWVKLVTKERWEWSLKVAVRDRVGSAVRFGAGRQNGRTR